MSDEGQELDQVYFRFNGGGDDTIEVAVQRDRHQRWFYQEYSALPQWPSSPTEWECTLVHDDGLSKEMLRVVATFGALWVLGVGPVDEDTPIPAWDILLTRCEHTPHSAELQVAAPFGTTMIRIHPLPRNEDA